jgi:hypothetical protein
VKRRGRFLRAPKSCIFETLFSVAYNKTSTEVRKKNNCREIRMLGEWDSLGETALTENAHRSASCTATSHVDALVLSKVEKGGERRKREERKEKERRGGREDKQEQAQCHEQSGMCAAGSGPVNESFSSAGAASAQHSHMEGAADTLPKIAGAAASIAMGGV